MTETEKANALQALITRTRPRPIRRFSAIRDLLFIATALALILSPLLAFIPLVLLYFFDELIEWGEKGRIEAWAYTLSQHAVNQEAWADSFDRERQRMLAALQLISRNTLSGLFTASATLDKLLQDVGFNPKVNADLTYARRVVDTQALMLLSHITRTTGHEAITPVELGTVLADATRADVLARMLAYHGTAALLEPDYIPHRFAEEIRHAARPKTT